MAKTERKPRKYTDEQRQNAVGLAHDKGLAEASKALGIAKTTIKTWAKNLNVEVSGENRRAQIEQATIMSVANRRQAVAEAKSRIVVLLATVAELGAQIEIDLLRAGDVSLPEVVGAVTRAIHDLQLLEGDPTEITKDVSVSELEAMRDELQALADMQAEQ